MQHRFEKVCRRVTLRPLEEKDIEYTRFLRNQYRNCFVFSDEVTEEAQKKWYKSYLSRDGDYMFAVCVLGQCVGTAAIYNVNTTAKCAEYGRLLIDKTRCQGRGFGQDVTQAACCIAFEQIGIETIVLEVFKNNISARKTYERCGFRYIESLDEKNGRQLLKMQLIKKDFLYNDNLSWKMGVRERKR